MSNFKKAVTGIVSVAFLALPAMTMAATVSNIQFDNGDVTTSGTGGATVNATFRLNVGAGEVVENFQTDVTGDNLAPVCTSVGGDLGLQEGQHDVTLPIKFPPNTGTYTVTVNTAGIFGGIRSVSCTDGGNGSASFGSALRVVSPDVSTTNTGGDSGAPTLASQVQALIAAVQAFIAAQAHPAPAPTPTTSAVCTAYAQANTGTMQGVHNDANVRLQGFLLSQGMSIPALTAGASFGFYGPQTSAANVAFLSMNQCH